MNQQQKRKRLKRLNWMRKYKRYGPTKKRLAEAKMQELLTGIKPQATYADLMRIADILERNKVIYHNRLKEI